MSASSRSRKRSSLKSRIHAFERLENRQMMAVTAALFGGELRIVGTNGDNGIGLGAHTSNGKLWIDAGGQDFDASLISKVVIDAKDGRDHIVVDNDIPAYEIKIHGGDGDDIIWGSRWRDVIYGGDGSDTIYGQNGNDEFFGGDGRDEIYGGLGNDTLRGEGGPDMLIGGQYQQNDTATRGRDRLFGGYGVDALWGGYGPDSYFGGPGFDFYYDPDLDTTRFVEDGYSATDVRQNDAPLCANLAALAAYANSGIDIGKRIRFRSFENGTAKYDITLYEDGEPTVVRVNLYSVTGDWNDNDAAPLNADGEMTNDLWPLLMNRARLKLLGIPEAPFPLSRPEWDAADLKTGNQLYGADLALATFTGWGISSLKVTSTLDPAMVKRRFHAAADVMVVSSKPAVAAGLVSSHAYAVLDIYKSGSKWMVSLYNPWGKDGRATAADGDDDGILAISWDAFKQNFLTYAVR